MKNLSKKLALAVVLVSPLLLGGCAGGGPFVGVDVGGPGYYDYPGYYGDYYGGGYYRRGYYRGGNYYRHGYNDYRADNRGGGVGRGGNFTSARSGNFSRTGSNATGVSHASVNAASSGGHTGGTGGGGSGGHAGGSGGGGGGGGGGHR